MACLCEWTAWKGCKACMVLNIILYKLNSERYNIIIINSFRYEGAKLWNELSQDFKVLPSIEDF